MKKIKISRNASEELGLMDTFLSRPAPKRWIFSKIAQKLYQFSEHMRDIALYFEPRQVHANERLLEIPFVLQRVPAGAKILDVGSTSSALALQLASLGYRVTGIDVRPYHFEHLNLTFLQEDISNCSIAPDSHDCAILISTLEHMGLGTYGDAKGMSDRAFLDTVARFVRPGGQILVTFPYGARFEGSWYRVYDANSMAALVSGYIVKEALFARRTGLFTFEMCSADALSQIPSEFLPVNGVALMHLIKPEEK